VEKRDKRFQDYSDESLEKVKHVLIDIETLVDKQKEFSMNIDELRDVYLFADDHEKESLDNKYMVLEKQSKKNKNNISIQLSLLGIQLNDVLGYILNMQNPTKSLKKFIDFLHLHELAEPEIFNVGGHFRSFSSLIKKKAIIFDDISLLNILEKYMKKTRFKLKYFSEVPNEYYTLFSDNIPINITDEDIFDMLWNKSIKMYQNHGPLDNSKILSMMKSESFNLDEQIIQNIITIEPSIINDVYTEFPDKIPNTARELFFF